MTLHPSSILSADTVYNTLTRWFKARYKTGSEHRVFRKMNTDFLHGFNRAL